MSLAPPLKSLTLYIGAHATPATTEHELDRAWQRILGCLVVILGIAVDQLVGRSADALGRILLALTFFYLLITVAYRIFLKSGRSAGVFALYAFLVTDPLMLVLVLLMQPQNFAFLNPFLFVVIVRYGIRTMYLSWSITLLSSMLLLTSEFWRQKVELTLTFFLMLILVPTFFSSLIRKIHGARTIEEERARLLARHESTAARSAFLAKVSHELRSPLQGIVSALDVLSMRRG